MKKITAILYFVFTGLILSFGQGYSIVDLDSNNAKITKTDGLVLHLFTDIWKKVPSNMNASSINIGFSTNIYKDIPIKASRFSFAVGLGISIQNLHSNSIPTLDSTGERMIFNNIPSSVNGSQITYSKNKLNFTYLDLPIELRFRSKSPNNKKMKYSLGFKFSYLIGKKTKYVGRDLNGEDKDVKLTNHNIKFLENYRFGLTARVGWAWFGVSAFYSLTPIFIKDKGPDIFPISIGITLSPFN